MKRAERETLAMVLAYAEGTQGRDEMLRNLAAMGIGSEHVAKAHAALRDDEHELLTAFLWFVAGVTLAVDLLAIGRALVALL